MHKRIFFYLVCLLSCSWQLVSAGGPYGDFSVPASNTYQSFFVPHEDELGATQSNTYFTGISGNYIVGYSSAVNNATSATGFLYDLSRGSFVRYSVPQSTATYLLGVAGSNLVGTYIDGFGVAQGFSVSYAASSRSFQNLTSYSSPGASSTLLSGIASSGQLVGSSVSSTSGQLSANSFATGAGASTAYNYAGASNTYGYGVSTGGIMVGRQVTSGITSGYAYSTSQGGVITSSNSSLISVQSSVSGGSPLDTYSWGISPNGSTAVGYYEEAGAADQSFVFNLAAGTFTDFFNYGDNSITPTYARGVDGDAIVGYYLDSVSGTYKGFLSGVGVPEPSTGALLGFVSVLALLFRRRLR
jgi:hypothetical protein